MLKSVGVDPVPNYTRDVGKGRARWDAYLHVPDPDALAAEFSSRDVVFFRPLGDDETGCVASSCRTLMDTSCSSDARTRLVHRSMLWRQPRTEHTR